MGKRILYKNSAGKRVPSVTTIISRFKDSGGLIYWANQQGLDGKTLDEARVPEADAGTLAHDLVEAHINGWEKPIMRADAEIIKKAETAFNTFLDWKENTKIDIQHTEVSLVSDKFNFGGKLDAIGLRNNALCLLDWKTGQIYADALLQTAAYTMLWDENYPDSPITGGVHVVRFSKENGDMTHSYFPEIEREKNTFLQMRRLYDAIKLVEKRVK